ncbi:MAG: DUF1294 domain-containing protein [Bacillus sp. (in: firmicutes)]
MFPMLLIILAFINMYGFFIMGIDKRKARNGVHRIPEKSLWLVSVVCGAIGTTAGMYHFRHKTRHPSFRIGLPVIALLQIIGFIYLFGLFG